MLSNEINNVDHGCLEQKPVEIKGYCDLNDIGVINSIGKFESLQSLMNKLH